MDSLGVGGTGGAHIYVNLLVNNFIILLPGQELPARREGKTVDVCRSLQPPSELVEPGAVRDGEDPDHGALLRGCK